MYTTKEVAKKLGVSRRTVTNLVKRGQLNASFKFEKAFAYTEEDIENYLNKKK